MRMLLRVAPGTKRLFLPQTRFYKLDQMMHPAAALGEMRPLKQHFSMITAQASSSTTHCIMPSRIGGTSQRLRSCKEKLAFPVSPTYNSFAVSCYSTSPQGGASPSSSSDEKTAPEAGPEGPPPATGQPKTDEGEDSSATSNGAAPLMLSAGIFMLPHPDKMEKGGEDWYFVSTCQRAIGVADGVGGWAEVGVDAGAYSRQLMAAAGEAVDEQLASGRTDLNPQDALEKAHTQTTVRGSCTACILAVNGNKLHASNLGDSGFLVMRKGAVIFQTPQQQHSFNFPFQIGSEDSMSDSPKVAERYTYDLQPGDIIVMGTDGLWDNCFPEEVMSVINYCVKGGMDAMKASQVMAHYARHRAADTKYASPFAYSAFQYGLAYLGGKMDDITVLVAYVQIASKL